MFRLLADLVVGLRSRRLTARDQAFSILAALVLMASGLVVLAIPASAVSAGNGDAPIVGVDLLAGGAPLSQGEPAEGVVDAGADAVEVIVVTVDDAGRHQALRPTGGAVSMANAGYPEGLTGVVVSENGATTAVGDEGFADAAGRVNTSTDLRDYLRTDGLSAPSSEWGSDYDLVLDVPLGAHEFLLVQERNGNTTFHLTALDAAGEPIGAGEPVVVEAPYGWNTGFAPSDSPGQPMYLTVLRASDFVDNVDAQIHGFRVDNDDEADIKITTMTPGDPFNQIGSDVIEPVEPTEDGTPEAEAAAEQADAEPEPAVDETAVDETAVDETELDDAAAGSETDESVLASEVTGSPGIGFSKTVYVGADGGARCADAPGFAEASADQVVTYCFTVVNTGERHLGSIQIDDPLIAGEVTLLAADSDPLAPGHTARYFVESLPPADGADGTVDETSLNTATVTAQPVDETGTPAVGAAPVHASAEAVVFPPEDIPMPDVALVTSVYTGVDGGAGCPSADVAAAQEGEPITYCYTVTNTGNTHLDSVTVGGAGVAGEPTRLDGSDAPLAPGETAVYFLESAAPATAAGGVDATAAVSANSVDVSGADLAGLADVSARDGARIEPIDAGEAPSPTTVPPSIPLASDDAAPATEPPATLPQPATPPPAAQADATTATPVVPAPAAAEAPATGTGAATAPPAAAEAPTELAYTGWDTWLFGAFGLALLLGGLWLLASTGRTLYDQQIARPLSR